MHRILRMLIVLGGTLVPAASNAQARAFIVRLGSDTFAIERFTRIGNVIDGALVRHTPSTSILKYSLALNPDGSIASYQEGIFRADGTPMPPSPQGVAQTGLKMTFVGDTVIREIARNGQAVVKRNTAPRGSLPQLGGASPLFQELAIAAAKRGGGTFSFFTFAMSQDTAVTLEVKMFGADSAEIWNSGFPRAFRLNRDGHIIRGDGARSTLKLVITPIVPVDIRPIAKAWAAKDAQGLAFGVPSTRDTVTARVGSANVWIDYGRPAKRGRVIWGHLVPFDTVWRFGANAAAQFKTDKDLEIGGSVVPAGMYSLWLLPSAVQSYLIVNKETGQWGTAYDPSKDLVRIPVKKRVVSTQREERFRVLVQDSRLVMLWDDGGFDVALKEK